MHQPADARHWRLRFAGADEAVVMGKVQDHFRIYLLPVPSSCQEKMRNGTSLISGNSGNRESLVNAFQIQCFPSECAAVLRKKLA